MKQVPPIEEWLAYLDHPERTEGERRGVRQAAIRRLLRPGIPVRDFVFAANALDRLRRLGYSLPPRLRRRLVAVVEGPPQSGGVEEMAFRLLLALHPLSEGEMQGLYAYVVRARAQMTSHFEDLATLLLHPSATPELWQQALARYQSPDLDVLLVEHPFVTEHPEIRARLRRSQNGRMLEALCRTASAEEFAEIFPVIRGYGPKRAAGILQGAREEQIAALPESLRLELFASPVAELRLAALRRLAPGRPDTAPAEGRAR